MSKSHKIGMCLIWCWCVCVRPVSFSFDELTEPHQINALRLSFAIVAVEYDWRKKAHTKQKKKLCRFHFTAEKNRADGKRTIVKSIWIIFFSQYVFFTDSTRYTPIYVRCVYLVSSPLRFFLFYLFTLYFFSSLCFFFIRQIKKKNTEVEYCRIIFRKILYAHSWDMSYVYYDYVHMRRATIFPPFHSQRLRDLFVAPLAGCTMRPKYVYTHINSILTEITIIIKIKCANKK